MQINKCLTEEKFLTERKNLNNKNKIISNRTLEGVNFNILPEGKKINFF
jgi:hypothetical protein